MTKTLNLNEYIKRKPWGVLDPYNCNLHPSVIKDNYNFKNKARFCITDNFVLGQLFLNGGDKLWSISSNKPIPVKELKNAANVARECDSNFTHFSLVSGYLLPDKLPKNISIHSYDLEESDYIYSTKSTTDMKSSIYATSRRYVKKFNTLYGDNITVDIYQDDSDKKLNDELSDLYHSWLDSAELNEKDLLQESVAFENYRDNRVDKSYRKAYKLVVRYKGKIVGISINDIVSEDTAINLYLFCNLNLTGVSHYLFHLTSRHLLDMGIVNLNFQEDRGSFGLRKFKKLLRPSIINETITLKFD